MSNNCIESSQGENLDDVIQNVEDTLRDYDGYQSDLLDEIPLFDYYNGDVEDEVTTMEMDQHL